MPKNDKDKEKGFNGLDPNARPDVSREPINTKMSNVTELGEGEMIESAIQNRATEIMENVAGLDKEKAEQVLLTKANSFGMTYATNSEMVQDLGLEPSQWLPKVGWKVIEQSLSRIDVTFPLADLIPLKRVALGKLLKNYTDNIEADEKPAYGTEYDDINKYYELLNPDGTIVVEEAWHVYRNIHKGLKVPWTSLNDITMYSALYIALVEAFEFNIAIPMARVLYQIRLLMIQDPEHFKNGYDWSTITPDITINATDEYDALTQLKDYMVGLEQPSRDTQPTAWIPNGLPRKQEIQLSMSDYVMIVPNNFKNVMDVQMKSGRFHENYLNVMPAIRALDFQKAFGEYIGATNMGVTFDKCDFRLVPVGKHKILEMYKGTTDLKLGYFATAFNVFERTGHFFDKEYPIFKGRIIITRPTIIQQVQVTNLPTDYAKDVTLTNGIKVTETAPITGFATETTLATLNKEATQQTLMKDATGQTIATNTKPAA